MDKRPEVRVCRVGRSFPNKPYTASERRRLRSTDEAIKFLSCAFFHFFLVQRQISEVMLKWLRSKVMLGIVF